MDLSIIVPVYNVERYIRSCIESIFKQRLDEKRFEIIIINDGTQDQSMEMISDIILQHNNIFVINQENQGLSVARNNGISVAKGEYILMPDSDDLLVENSLRPLLDNAIDSQADLVIADFLSMTDEEIMNTNISLLQKKKYNYIEKTGEELYLQDLNPYQCYVWRTLFRKEFLMNNNITFVPGIYIQDMPFTHECYLKARKCIRASWLLNIYRRGHESATFSFNKKKTKDFCTAVAKAWELTSMENISPIVQAKLRDNIYTSFSAIIWIIIHKIHHISDRNDIIDHLRHQAPNLRFRNGKKQRIETYLYLYAPHLLIHLHFLHSFLSRK